MRFFKLPSEIKVKIIQDLPRKDRLKTRLVSQDFRDHAEDSLIWKDVGATSYADFLERMRKLPPKLRDLVLLNERYQYTLPLAEKVASFLTLPFGDKRFEALFSSGLFTQEQAANTDRTFAIHLISDNCIMALCEERLSSAQIATMPNHEYLEYLTSDNGMIALREGLITPEQAIAMSSHTLRYLISATPSGDELSKFSVDQILKGLAKPDQLGLNILREGLITPEQAAALPHAMHLSALISKAGITALREGLITLAKAAAIDSNYLDCLMTENGVTALREGLITIEQATAMPSHMYLNALFSERSEIGMNAVFALREGLITPEQIAAIHHDEHLYSLLSDNGLVALRKGIITPEEAGGMNVKDLSEMINNPPSKCCVM